MSSTPLASIIRQPHGPSSNGFGAAPPAQQTGNGPPTADAESTLRRHNTVSAPRHQPSASVSSTPATSSAFHGSMGRFRSGSLTGSNPDPGLVRKGSGRAVRKEEAVLESTEEGTTEIGSWGKGLSRQSSLPSRRGLHKSIATSAADPLPRISLNAPARPPRRGDMDDASQPSVQAPPSAHSASHSLSSLAMFSPPASTINLNLDSPVQFSGPLVSRTQSLRAQAKHSESAGLGRSYSLKASGEHRSLQTYQAGPPVHDQHSSPSNTFTSSSPPPVSSSAAFPPFQLPTTDDRIGRNPEGSDLKRHQSLTQGYGSSSRVRERLERSPVVLSLQQREGIRRLDDGSHSRTLSQDQPPTSPIGRSVWSPSHVGDDGWGRPSIQHLQETFQAMNFNLPPQDDQDRPGKTGPVGEPLRHPQDGNMQPHSQLADEPSWVANLVGHADRNSPQPPRTASAPNWQDRDTHLRQQPTQHAPWPVQPHYMQPFGFMPQQPILEYDNRQSGVKTPVSYGPQYNSPYPAYLGPNFNPLYPSPPGTAPLPSEDADVIRLAKIKGLNPASFNCQPPQARFFVIKSYTEEDVQKSLKHEIWSSTVLGNKRLDTAFRESSDKMPIYLFFSVNGSRHFCGVAQMLTPVDETQSSNVWSENNKWKGIFKVKWIFVRDVPTAALRHIRLMNTPEQKPITNSRDTQELHYEAGCEVLQIFLDYQNKSKTSLLQDFAYYERLSANRPPSAAEQRMGAPAAAHPQANYNLPEPAHQSPYPVVMGPPGSAPGPPIPPVPPIPSRFR